MSSRILAEEIQGVKSDAIMYELSEILEAAAVSISWWGRRVVTVEGYEGEIELRKLAEKFFTAKPFVEMGLEFSQRWDCYLLYSKIESLFIDGAKAYNQTWIYRFLPKETIPYSREWVITQVFKFTITEFEKIWPNRNEYIEQINFDGTKIRIPLIDLILELEKNRSK